jgi:two-component system OmpR family response regulator
MKRPQIPVPSAPRAPYRSSAAMPRTILIADDDPHIREILVFCLEKAGFRVIQAADGAAALQAFERDHPDLLVLDIGMPEMDGLEVCRHVRRSSDMPILFLSSRDEEIDRVVGLELGGDDYVTKPFSPRELVARVQAILKRARAEASATPTTAPLSRGGLSIDPEGYAASWNGAPVALTHTEFLLLATLLRHPAKVYPRDQLMDGVYRDGIVSDRTIDSHIRRIRQKFAEAGAANIVETMHGVGYKLGSCA